MRDARGWLLGSVFFVEVSAIGNVSCLLCAVGD